MKKQMIFKMTRASVFVLGGGVFTPTFFLTD